MRKYKIETFTWTTHNNKKLIGKVSQYKVTDRYENESEDERPPVAEFPISALYDAESQELRAKKLADYLNDINEKMSMWSTLSSTPMGT